MIIVLVLFLTYFPDECKTQSFSSYLFRFVCNFPHHPQDLYKSKTVLTYYSDECQTQSLGDYYANYVTDFPPYPQVLYDQMIQRLFWCTTLMSVRRKAIVAVTFNFIINFPPHSEECSRSYNTYALTKSYMLDCVQSWPKLTEKT